MIFNRRWEMPNKNTFDIKCIKKLIGKYNNESLLSVDPFANKNKLAKITNDIDLSFDTTYNLDAHDFLCGLDGESVDILFFDPPFSARQVSECYKKVGRTVNMETTQSSFWAKLRDEIARVMKKDGIVISFGWNSNGVGITRGFEQLEILLVSHGGQHNDTICTVERKIK